MLSANFKPKRTAAALRGFPATARLPYYCYHHRRRRRCRQIRPGVRDELPIY